MNIPEKNTVMVTGGAGFIGSHIVDRLISTGHRVIVVDDLSCGKEGNINANAEFHKLSVEDLDRLRDVFVKTNPDYVIHQAAKINLNVMLEDPLRDVKSSVLGTLNLLKCSADLKVKKFIYASSVAVYGRPPKLPVVETDELIPVYSYGIAKKTAEEYVKFYAEYYGLNYSVLRYANVYGPRQPIYGEVGVIAIFTEKAVNGEPFVIFGDGGHLRDYIYIDDVVDVSIKTLNSGDCEIFNIGSGKGTSVNELYSVFSKCCVDLKAVNKPERYGELGRFYTDSSKALSLIGWKARIGTEEGIERTLKYYRELYEKQHI